MSRYLMIVILLSSLVVLSACELDSESRRPALIARQTETPTPRPTSTPSPTSTATLVQPPTATAMPTATPVPTNTPAPTMIPSDRLAAAQRAYASGDYESARGEFATILADPGATTDEQRQALHWRGRSELNLGDTAAAMATLQMFLRQYPSDELARAAQFNLGQAYEQAGQFDQAIEAYLGSIIPAEAVNVYIYERIGDVSLNTGAYTETIVVYQNGIDATDDPSLKMHLREGIAQAELLRGNPDAAIAHYEDILDMATAASYRAKILRLLGDTYLEIGQPEAAYERYLEAVNRYPEAYDSYLALVELVVNADVPVDEFQRGLVDYYAKAYEPAIAAFERYLEARPTEPLTSSLTITSTEAMTHTLPDGNSAQTYSPGKANKALWFKALSHRALGQYNSAILTFQRLIDEYPESSDWGQAHLEIGQTLINQGNYTQAKATLREFATLKPDHTLTPEALWLAARLDMTNELFDEAQPYFLELVKAYPASHYASDALYWAGQAAYQLGDYEEAIGDWARLVAEYPHSELVSFGAYWQAKTLLALNRDDEAKAVLTKLSEGPLDYYRLRGQDLLTGNQPETTPIELPDDAELMAEQAEAEAWLRQWLALTDVTDLSALGHQIRNDSAFQRGDALLELGLRDKALVELERVKDNWWHDALVTYQLSLYFREKNLGRLSILTAARLVFLSPAQIPEDAPAFIQRLYYPIYFPEVIFAEVEQLGVDPALLVALIRQESLFELSAESIAGARGLTQVMPATGEYVAQNSNFENFETGQLWLPYVSIKFGVWYLKQQLEIFEGNQFAALAAYNAGPGNVSEWIKTSNDLDIFVESIPFWESRTYIRRIYVNLAAYRRLYNPASADQP